MQGGECLQMNRFQTRLYFAWAVTFSCLVGPSHGGQEEPGRSMGPPPASVKVQRVSREQVQERRRVTGELRARRRSRVATQEEGLVVEVTVEAGDRVKRSDVLARLDTRRLELLKRAAEADELAAASLVDERNATLAWRQRDLELYQSSFDRGGATPRELRDAESVVRVAQARAHQAERQQAVIRARTELLAERLKDMTIVAPFDGVVVQKHTELGEWVGEGDAVVELVSTGLIDVWLDIPQRYFAALREGTPEISINVEATGGSISVGQMRVVTQVDPKARSFSCVATIDNSAAGGRLAPGMSLTAWIPTGGSAKRLLVSRNAILRNEAGAFLYVARQPPGAAGGDAAIAVPLRVTVSFGVGDRVVVQGPGLKEGDLVVVEGNERLFPMMPIIPIPAEDDRAPAEAPGDET